MLTVRTPPDQRAISAALEAIVAQAYDPADTRGVRSFALQFTRGARNPNDAARMIYDALYRIRYEYDPRNREFVQRPLFLLLHAARGSHLAVGDCDDFACMALALLTSIGHKCRIVLSEDPDNPGPENDPWWSHIHIEVRVSDEGWRAVDPALKWLTFGERVPGRRVYIDPEGFSDETLDGRPQLGMGTGIGDIVGGVLSNVTGLVKGLVGSRAQVKVAQFRAQAQAAASQAEAALLERLAELDFEAAQLEAARADEARREAAAFDELERQARVGALVPVFGGLAALAAVMVLSIWWRKR